MAVFGVNLKHYMTGCILIHLSCVFMLAASVSGKEQSSRIKYEDQMNTMYMSEHCRAMIWEYIIDSAYQYVDDQTLLMAHPLSEIEQSKKYVTHDDCVMTIAAPPRQKLLLHFLDIAIDYRDQYKSRLYIFDGFSAETRISPYNGLYGETKSSSPTFSNIVMKDHVSKGQALTLMFKGYLSKRFYGFKAVVTPIRKANRNGTCPAGMFQCAVEKFCIEMHLTCNGIPNCGERDNSDEKSSRCNAKSFPLTDSNIDNLGLMIGCGVSILVLLLAVIWVGVMCQKRHRLRQQRHQLTWQQGSESPPSSESSGGGRGHSRWLPGMFHDHLSPWGFHEPPPSYTDSVQSEEVTANFDLPPPYAPKSTENRSLMWNQQGQASHSNPRESLARNSQVIANPGAMPIAPGEQSPSYEEGGVITAQGGGLCQEIGRDGIPKNTGLEYMQTKEDFNRQVTEPTAPKEPSAPIAE